MSFFTPPTDDEVEEEWNDRIGEHRKCLSRQEARRRVFLRKVGDAMKRCENHFVAQRQAGQTPDPVVETLFDMLSHGAKDMEID